MFGLYIHIPYCLQRCSYCDFATFVYDQIMPPERYVQFLIQELRQRRSLIPDRPLTSIYFGGGTPSLLPPSLILSVLDEVGKLGARQGPATEITLEINPATLNTSQLEELIDGGVNRFSVGAQTFNDALLKGAGRKHSSNDTRRTLDLLRKKNVNYTFDLLFALPHQTVDHLKEDLKIIADFAPPHLSAYCLTVPQGHPMSYHRIDDDGQVEMFALIEESLSQQNLRRYEISNFAKPGFESQHNLLYWKDGEYVGLGLSAHSYVKSVSPWGARFWNPSSIEGYEQHIAEFSPDSDSAPLAPHEKKKFIEYLTAEQSRFDYSHTALRLEEGLVYKNLIDKFGTLDNSALIEKLDTLTQQELLQNNGSCWRLTARGRLLSNTVFAELML